MKFIKGVQTAINVMLALIILVLLLVFFVPQCMGYQPYNIQTGSMRPKYPIGSMIYVKAASFDAIHKGDVITYRTAEDSGWVVTHRVTKIDKKEQTIVTKGDANNSEDGAISYGSVIGKASNFSIPYLGKISTEYQNGNGKIITVVCIVVLLGVSFLLDLVKKQTNLEEGEE